MTYCITHKIPFLDKSEFTYSFQIFHTTLMVAFNDFETGSPFLHIRVSAKAVI